MFASWSWCVLFAALVLAGCVLDELDISRFPCPCAAGYECEPAVDRCVPENRGDGVVVVRDLRADWTTPNWIHWRWEPEAPDDHQLARYELVVAETVDELLDRSGTARVFDPDTNLEFGWYVLPRGNGVVIVDETLTSGHAPDKEYVALLMSIDTSGKSWRSNIARARTGPVPTGAIVIVDEEDPPGYEIPPSACFHRVEGDGAYNGGSAYFLREHVCTGDNDHLCEPNRATEEECWVNLRTQDVGLSLEALTEAGFDRAYLEFALSNGGSTTSFWSHAGLNLRQSDGSRTLWLFEEITFPPTTDYVMYQIRLDQMPINNRELDLILTYEDIAASELFAYRVGGRFENGAQLRLDAIAIRW